MTTVTGPDFSVEGTHRPRGLRVLRVLRCSTVTPLMRRITLGGSELAGFGEGPNVKVLVPPSPDLSAEMPFVDTSGRTVWPSDPARCPTMRTYTVRRYDPESGELDIDFLLHGRGAAAAWAQDAQPGHELAVLGPGGRSVGEAEHYLIVADHCSLPAVARTLPRLPRHARGTAYLEVPNTRECQEIDTPAGMRVRWLHRQRPGALLDAVRDHEWPSSGSIFAWVAGESASVRAIRNFLRREQGIGSTEHLAIGYWKRGLDETEYHDKHNNDRDEDYYRAGDH